MPTTLRRLYVFEDFNKIIHPKRSIKRANPSLGKTFSKSTRSLEIFSAAFLIDAEDFFADFWPTKPHNSNVFPWKNLRKLALTSRLLHPKIRRGKINKLLIAAGRAAAFMPKLEVMEIRNGGEGHACVFRYSTNAKKARISWSSNWGINVQLDYNVVNCWADLVDHGHTFNDLTTAVNKLPIRRRHAYKNLCHYDPLFKNE